MADDGQAAPSGRGGGAGGRSGARKFMPTMPGRRKKAEEGGGPSAAEAAASDEAFKDLIKQAQTAGSGRGRGRGRFGQQRFQVTFGAFGDDRPALAAAKQYPRSGGPGGGFGGGAGGRGGGGGGGGGGAGGSRPKSEGGAADGDEAMQDAGDSKGDFKPSKPRPQVLDYQQYYPTLLPLRLPGQEIWEDDADAASFQPSSLDLAVMPDLPQRPATELDLFDPAVEDQMFLLQLPAVLPLNPPGRGEVKAEKGEKEGAAGPGPGPSSERRRAAAAAQAARAPGSEVRDLPSGRIGKLLVFRSGRVAMRVGDVLMDVSIGTPNQHRQDVVAISAAGKACVLLGDVQQRVLVAPDVMQLLRGSGPPEFRSAPELLPELTAEHRRARGYEVPEEEADGAPAADGAAAAAAAVGSVKIKAEQG